MPTTIVVSECDDGARVRAHVGDTIEIRLPENATAGYRWALDDLDADVCELTESGADYPPGPIGCGGEAAFRVAVRGQGNTAVQLKYWRHWEGERGIRKRFSITVEARPQHS